ncbi:hypothetical protein FM036_47585 [Nostoc sp. HG1]|nr:hypothetical protein [Nostoc sp. HG1]
MKSLVEKRGRIAKVRAIQKRVAELELANADRRLQHIRGIVERLATLKSGLSEVGAQTNGASLAARSETNMRLNNASRATAVPLNEAIAGRARKNAAMLAAHRTADGAETLLQRSTASFERAKETRTDANRVSRRSRFLGDGRS